MNIYVGADHRGFDLKKKTVALLKALGHAVIDVGSHTPDPCDYPLIALAVAQQVAKDPRARGILLCLSGVGHAIAANKVPGAYAALAYNKEAAILSRQHNDANILVLGSKFVDENEIGEIIEVWLATAFEGGRHQPRVDQVKNIEQKYMKGL